MRSVFHRDAVLPSACQSPAPAIQLIVKKERSTTDNELVAILRISTRFDSISLLIANSEFKGTEKIHNHLSRFLCISCISASLFLYNDRFGTEVWEQRKTWRVRSSS
eukprot:754582-Hanusia_phi.AAC.12